MHIKVSLVSSYRRHGSAGPKPTKVRSTAASKFMAILNKNVNTAGDSSSTSKDGSTRTEGQNKPPKEYGKHDGNLQVCILKELDINEETDDLSTISNYITNLTSNFEAKNSFDLRKAKSGYKRFKDSVVKHYAEEYGTNLSEAATTKMLQELATGAFRYTSHQIVVVISSDKPISGGRQNSEDNKYYITIKSKMVYRENKQLFTDAEIQAMKSMDDSSVKLSVTSIVRVPAILKFNSKLQCYEIQYSGTGTVTASDGYA